MTLDPDQMPDHATPEHPTRLAFLLSQVGAFSSRRFAERVQELGLTPSEVGVLRFVARSPGSSQRVLADRIGSAPSRVVALVDSLEQSGLLERLRGRDDRRNSELWITPSGRELLSKLRVVAREHEADVVGALDAHQREQLGQLLASIAAAKDLDRDLHEST